MASKCKDNVWQATREISLERQVRRAARLVRRRSRHDELCAAVGGKRVLITGASCGVGRDAALAVAAAGAETILVARRAERLAELAEEIMRAGGVAHVHACDLSDREQASELARTLITTYGGVDVLVNNAGRSIRRSVRQSADRLHDYERTMTLNYFGMLWLTVPIVDHMRRRGGCHVVNVSTIGTQVQHQARFSAYLASKTALDGFTRVASTETRADGVRWTTVHLPLVRTEMIAPTSSYQSVPAMTQAQGAEMVLDAIRYRTPKVSHPVGTFAEVLNAVAPGVLDRAMAMPLKPTPPAPLPRVAIIGSGVAGLAMAMRLQAAGTADFTVYEKADRVGGTWRENHYPGLACDIPAHYYRFKDEANPDWSRMFSPGPEIQAYIERVAERRGLLDHITFNTEVVSAEFAEGGWDLQLSNGEVDRCDVLVCATGVLHHPRLPEIDGLETFAGPMFHSARWDHGVDLAGKRVGVIGSGSTGVQILTALASSDVAAVSLFQRTPHWVATIPNPRLPVGFKAALRHVPGASSSLYRLNRKAFDVLAMATTTDGWQRRLATAQVERSLAAVADPVLREQLRPSDIPGCKRLIFSPGFYEAIQSERAALVTQGIAKVVPDGIVTDDGTLHELDVLVCATGFQAQNYMRPMKLTGRDGVTLEEAWSAGPRAHLTTTIPGFPNLFMLLGPNSPVGNSSFVAIAETQADYVLRWLDRMRTRNIAEVEPRQDATDRFYAEVTEAFPETVWATGCDSWYLGEGGQPLLWPWPIATFRDRLSRLDLADFVERSRDVATDPAPA
ncbi:MAG: SDR family NAD(P)-dependent oxidoreductase [Marmoricola sp.]